MSSKPKLNQMTLEEAEYQIADLIYTATALFEDLERAGKIRGNGHHIRQKLAAHAIDEMRGRWVK